MYWCTKGRDLPLEGRMGDGIHFAMDYLTEQTQLLNGEIDDITITAKDKNVIIIGAGDTGADCVATALRKIVNRLFNLINIRNCQKQLHLQKMHHGL